jgi:hypothetical protein
MKYLTKRSLILLQANKINDCTEKKKIEQSNGRIYSMCNAVSKGPRCETVGYFDDRWRERLAGAQAETSQMAATIYTECSIPWSVGGVQLLNRAQAHGSAVNLKCGIFEIFLLHITYLLTPWIGVLLEKLTGLQLVKKFPAFYGT